MSANSPQPDQNRIQRELRLGRPFSLADVIAQEGATFLQGESPVPPEPPLTFLLKIIW
jgi:hypothetical protein